MDKLEYPMFDKVWRELISNKAVQTSTPVTTTVATIAAKTESIGLKIGLIILIIFFMITSLVALYILMLIKQVIKSPPSWSLRCFRTCLPNIAQDDLELRYRPNPDENADANASVSANTNRRKNEEQNNKYINRFLSIFNQKRDVLEGVVLSESEENIWIRDNSASRTVLATSAEYKSA